MIGYGELDGMRTQERNLLWRLAYAADRSPWLDETKKRAVERLLRQLAAEMKEA